MVLFGGLLLFVFFQSISGQATCSTQLRLVGGGDQYAGRVEVLIGGVWQTVCDDSWDILEANVVCQQLGYGTGRSAVTDSHFGEGGSSQWERSWLCTGTESCLQDCTSFIVSDSTRCSSDQNAGVICSLSITTADGIPTIAVPESTGSSTSVVVVVVVVAAILFPLCCCCGTVITVCVWLWFVFALQLNKEELEVPEAMHRPLRPGEAVIFQWAMLESPYLRTIQTCPPVVDLPTNLLQQHTCLAHTLFPQQETLSCGLPALRSRLLPHLTLLTLTMTSHRLTTVS